MIYLDIDGVMLAGQDYSSNQLSFSATRIALLTQLLDHTGAGIILSSSWRRGDAGRDILDRAGLLNRVAVITAKGTPCDWRTPFLDGQDINDGFGNKPAPQFNIDLSIRGQEIQAHIDAFT